MRVGVLLHVDRHADPELLVFVKASDAIVAAKQRVRAFDRFHDRKEFLTPEMKKLGWVYYGTYGEGNSVRVEEREVIG